MANSKPKCIGLFVLILVLVTFSTVPVMAFSMGEETDDKGAIQWIMGEGGQWYGFKSFGGVGMMWTWCYDGEVEAPRMLRLLDSLSSHTYRFIMTEEAVQK